MGYAHPRSPIQGCPRLPASFLGRRRHLQGWKRDATSQQLDGRRASRQGRRGYPMPTVTQHAPGTFCWPECATTDSTAAKTFYTSLFGWQFKDNDMGPGGTYTIFTKSGSDVAALYQ